MKNKIKVYLLYYNYNYCGYKFLLKVKGKSLINGKHHIKIVTIIPPKGS